jgi:hypothetical protein
VLSTATLFESSLNVGPRALVIGIGFEIGKPGVEENALLGRYGDLLIRERIPKRLNKLQAVPRAQPASFFEKVRAHAVSIPPTHLAPNGLRLSGERSGAE